MGVIIPMFKSNEHDVRENKLSPEEKLHLKLLRGSVEALKREEKAVEDIIAVKCAEEIERLNIIDRKMRDLEYEIEELCGGNCRNFRPYCGR